jgi:hypothetical protein
VVSASSYKMKTWRAVSLINKSRLPSTQKLAYVTTAIKRFKLCLNEAQLISFGFNHVDTAKLSKRYSIPIEVSKLKGITKEDFVKVSKYINVTAYDIFTCFKNSTDRIQILQRLNMKVDVFLLLGQLNKNEEMFLYKSVINRLPSRVEIDGFCQMNRVGIQMYERTCREFGYDPIFEDAVNTLSPFTNPVRVYFDCISSNIKVNWEYLIDRKAPVGILVRHMWNTGEPNLYNHKLSQNVYGDQSILAFIYAKICIRKIQSFFRYCIKSRAAIKIQRRWRKSVSDPTFILTRKRLLREFDELL